MASVGRSPALCPGEILTHIDNIPCLYKFSPADKEKPLVVLIPGGAHTARIFYGGHLGHDPEDFLVSWLTRKGFGALAISYPLETEPTLMPPVAPGFRTNQWGSQAAAVSKIVVDENRLCGDIVLVGWSMGGRLLVPYSKAAVEHGLKIRLFVSLSATPGLPGIRPPPPGRRRTKAGYASFSTMPKLFMAQIQEQEQINNKVIIPPEIYYSRYYGHTPVSLLGWGLKYNGEGEFVDDNLGSVHDSAAHDYASLPWISILWPTSQLDARHALSDKATWAFLLTQRLTCEFEDERRAPVRSTAQWDNIIEFVHCAPASLSASVSGSHYFFLGRSGAKATAEGIIQHLSTAYTLQSQWDSLVEEVD